MESSKEVSEVARADSETKESPKPDGVKINEKQSLSVQEIEVLKEYADICKRHPSHKGHRKGIRKELEKLALKYPGVSFPGSWKLKSPVSKEEITLKIRSDKLGEIINSQLHKSYPKGSFYKRSVKVLSIINHAQMISRSELLSRSNLPGSTLSAITATLIRIKLIKSYLSGKYHHYGIQEEGRKFLEETV